MGILAAGNPRREPPEGARRKGTGCTLAPEHPPESISAGKRRQRVGADGFPPLAKGKDMGGKTQNAVALYPVEKGKEDEVLPQAEWYRGTLRL
jgi:hypothetical protein